MLSYVLRKIQSDILGVGGATIFEVKSVTIIPSLPYVIYLFNVLPLVHHRPLKWKM